MTLITPTEISLKATISEEELRARMVREALASIGALDANGKAAPGLKTSVKRGTHGGYTIEVSGPAPRRFALLPPPE